jgi:hypothetical protein
MIVRRQAAAQATDITAFFRESGEGRQDCHLRAPPLWQPSISGRKAVEVADCKRVAT